MPELENLVPIIVILTYFLAELIKKYVIKNDEQKTLIPIFCAVVGGILGAGLYAWYPEGIPNCTSFVSAIISGAISGAASTGCNQIYKQLKDNSYIKDFISKLLSKFSSGNNAS